MTEVWVCTKCGSPSGEPAIRLLDGDYGTQRCGSNICKREKRIFHKETVDGDTRRVHRGGGERHPEKPEG